MKSLLLSLGLFLAFASMCVAQTPQEVLTPYRQYREALKAGDGNLAKKQAKKAWEKAEALIGDSKLTADLAQNYADLIKYSNPNDATDVYERSAELVTVKDVESAEIKLARLVSLSEALISTSDYKDVRHPIAEAQGIIADYKLYGITFDGEIRTLAGWERLANDKKKSAIGYFDQAIKIFNSPGHQYYSVFPYLVHIYKGDALQGENEYIDAALQYQVVMQNLEGLVEKEHPYVTSSFHKWMFMRSMINHSGDNEKALEAGVCKCWPYDEMSSDGVLPVLRMSPVMPRRAERSGHVNFKFDVNDEGEPINIEVVNATEKLFVDNATEALEAWEYEPFREGDDPDIRKGLVAKITFRLMDSRGELVPEAR